MRALMRSTIASYLILQAYSLLSQDDINLVAQILRQESCTTLLYQLESSDIMAISPRATNPLLVVTHGDQNKERTKEMLSSKQSRCVTVLAHYVTLNEGSIETLLNRTTYRSVYVFGAEMEKDNHAFHDYFKESVINVHFLLSGNLKLSKIIDNIFDQPRKDITWLKSSNNSFTLGKIPDRYLLRGRNVSVSAVILSPYVTYDNGKYRGIEIDILEIVSQKMGFHYHVKTEAFFVNRDPKTNMITGIIGKVIDGTSQIGLNTAFMNELFYSGKLVELSPELYFLELVYEVPKAKPLTPYLNFVKPFTLTLWLAWLAAYVSCSIFSFIMIRRHCDYQTTLWEIAFKMFGAMWQQNLKRTIRSPNFLFSIIFGVWVICVSFKGAAYNCNLRSSIVKKEYEKPIDTDEDLLRTQTDLYFPMGTGLPEMYRYSGSSAKRELYARAVQRKTVMTLQEYLAPNFPRKVVATGGALITTKDRMSANLIKYKNYFGYQPFVTTKFTAFASPSGWSIPLNQPWAEEFKLTILQILASGMVNKIMNDNIPGNKYTNSVKEEDVLEPYALKHLAGPLILLAAGLLLSLMAVVLEIVAENCFRRQKVTAVASGSSTIVLKCRL